MADRACEYDTFTGPDGRVVVVMLSAPNTLVAGASSPASTKRNLRAACWMLLIIGPGYCGPPKAGVPGTTMVADGGADADDADLALPPWSATAAPPAAAPPRMARSAMVRDEL